ncbi:MAG: hypothetical protein IPK22_27145 [Verrucomicrobiaceae bacterium]|nr:hypothetical protein [Verrucomicrobiaceae bacterium]
MLTVGLLVILDSPSPHVMDRLRAHPAMTVGEVADRWLPVAVEADDDESCREYHDWIAAQPGVAFIDVVHVNFEEPDADSNPSPSP